MKKNLFMLLLMAAVLACPSTMMAQRKTNKAKTEKKDTLTVLQERASAGDAKAQNTLGKWYYTGQNVKQDYEKAAKYWALSAKQDNVDAIGNLALCYQMGRGVKNDSVQAVKLYKKAFKAGNTALLNQHIELADKKNAPFSILLLKDYYTEVKDKAGVQKYLKKAAELGDTDSQTKLAMQLLREKKPAEAVKWFKTLADKKNLTGVYYYGYLLFNGMGVKQDKEQGIRFLTAAAKAKLPAAYSMLGKIYYEGDGTERDLTKAVDYLKMGAAAKNGDIKTGESQKLLGMCYMNGEGVKKDFDQAAQWFAEAFRHNRDKEIRQLIEDEKDGVFRNYIEGLKLYYVDKDYAKAIDCFKKTEKSGVADGLTMQALCQADEENPKANAKKAFKTMLKAAETSAAAKFYLAQMYQEGKGTEKDVKQATDLVLKAAEAGNGFALEKAGNMYFEGQGVSKDYVKAAEYYLMAEALSKLTPASARNLAKCYTMNISSLPDLNNAQARIEQLNKVTASNRLLDMLKKL